MCLCVVFYSYRQDLGKDLKKSNISVIKETVTIIVIVTVLVIVTVTSP